MMRLWICFGQEIQRMKRNWDLIRSILLKLESQSEARGSLLPDGFTGFDSETVSYHFKLLQSAGLIEAIDYSSLNEMSLIARSLTWQGHELLDKIRNDTVWNSLKTTIKSKSLDLSLDTIKQVAQTIISQMLA